MRCKLSCGAVRRQSSGCYSWSVIARAEWLLASGWLLSVACLEPVDWTLPTPPVDARSVAIYLEGETGPRVLLAAPQDQPQAYAVLGRPTLLAYSPRTLGELEAPRILETMARTACDRRRPIPAVTIFRGSAEDGWSLATDAAEFGPFSLPPLDLAKCLRGGCVRRDLDGVYYCATNCAAPDPPVAPNRAECPEGWRDSSPHSAHCQPPTTRSCANPPCWIFPREQGEVCEPRAPPLGVEPQLSSVLPAQVSQPLWLPRGRYTGAPVVLPGGALFGECHQSTTIRGRVTLQGGGRISDLGLEVEDGTNGLVIEGRGALVERVRIQGGEYGVVLTAGAQAELRSLQVQDAVWGLTAQDARLDLRHYYATGCANEGLSIEASTGTVADAVVLSNTRYLGVAVRHRDGDPSPPPLALERLYVEGQHQAQVQLGSDVSGRDLRSDGDGMAAVGIEISREGAQVDLERVFFSDMQEDAIWSRRGARPLIRDLLVRSSGGGVLCSTPLQLERAKLEDLRGQGIKVDGGGEVQLHDLEVLGARQGAHLIPEFDEPHSVQLRRVRFEGSGGGLVRGPGQITMEDVLISGASDGVRAEACWIDEALSEVSLEGVATPFVIEEP